MARLRRRRSPGFVKVWTQDGLLRAEFVAKNERAAMRLGMRTLREVSRRVTVIQLDPMPEGIYVVSEMPQDRSWGFA